MHEFGVWAPTPSSVELVVDGRRVAMARDPDAWWHATDASARPGSRYGFSLDGREPRPDPRSASQPDGVLGLSEVVDHTAFAWTDSTWPGRPLPGTVIYELHVGTFSPEGTFDGAARRLHHLVELGVDAVEVMPVAEFSGERGWGYDGVDLYAPHHVYGGPEGFKRFVDACHAARLAVVLDVVYNHLGPVGNFLPAFGPYFSDRHHTFWGSAPNFDGPGSAGVRRFVVDNALMWMRDYHVDGFRLDAVDTIADDSPVHILLQLADEVSAAGAVLGRHAFVIAESEPNEPRLIRSPADGGYGLDAEWADDWHHALHAVLTHERAGYYEDFGSLPQLGKALRQAWVYDGVWSPRRRAVRGASPAGLQPHQFVVAAQNHDQVGNRVAGERIGRLAGECAARAAAALLLTTPFTPLLFQGEEWDASTPFLYFTDHADPELGRAVSEGRKHEFAAFGWKPEAVPDPQDPATFERSRLRWDELDEPRHREMLAWYRDLLALRRRLPPPGDSVGQGVEVHVDEAARRLTFRRPGVAVYVNLGAEEWAVGLQAGERVVLSAPAMQPASRLALPKSGVLVVAEAAILG